MFIQNETKQSYQILKRSPDFSRDRTPRLGEQGVTSRTTKQRTLPNRATTIILRHPPHRKLPPRPTGEASSYLDGKRTAPHPPRPRALAPPEHTTGSRKRRERADPIASSGRTRETMAGEGEACAAVERHERT